MIWEKFYFWIWWMNHNSLLKIFFSGSHFQSNCITLNDFCSLWTKIMNSHHFIIKFISKNFTQTGFICFFVWKEPVHWLKFLCRNFNIFISKPAKIIIVNNIIILIPNLDWVKKLIFFFKKKKKFLIYIFYLKFF